MMSKKSLKKEEKISRQELDRGRKKKEDPMNFLKKPIKEEEKEVEECAKEDVEEEGEEEEET